MMLDRCAQEAADPSTPLPTLRKHLRWRADHVLANPAWELAEATEPQLLRSLTTEEWCAIVESRRATQELLRLAIQDSESKRTKYSKFACGRVELALSLRSDIPRDTLERIATAWRPEIVNMPELEIATHRLGIPARCSRGWRAVLPVVFRNSASVALGKHYKEWGLVFAMLRDGQLHPAAPVLECLPAGVPTAGSHPVADAARSPSTALRDVLGYVRMSRCLSRYIDLGHMLTRSMLRRWEGGGELGPMPERCAAAPIGGNRKRDPWESERNWHRTGVADHAGWDRCIPPAASIIESADRYWPTDWVYWAYLSSTLCEPPELENSARSSRWVERLAAASNPTLPDALRVELTDDVHWLVRAAALESWVIP